MIGPTFGIHDVYCRTADITDDRVESATPFYNTVSSTVSDVHNIYRRTGAYVFVTNVKFVFRRPGRRFRLDSRISFIFGRSIETSRRPKKFRQRVTLTRTLTYVPQPPDFPSSEVGRRARKRSVPLTLSRRRIGSRKSRRFTRYA